MIDDKSFLCPRVKLINERNIISESLISATVDKLFTKMNEQINLRLGSEKDDIAQGSKPSGVARVWGSQQPREHEHSSDKGGVARVWGSRPTESASSKKPVITNKIGNVKWYNSNGGMGEGYVSFDDGSGDVRFTSKHFSGFTLKPGNKVTLELHDNKLHSIKKNRFGGGNEKNEEMYKERYLKYKNKYIQLKSFIKTN